MNNVKIGRVGVLSYMGNLRDFAKNGWVVHTKSPNLIINVLPNPPTSPLTASHESCALYRYGVYYIKENPHEI